MAWIDPLIRSLTPGAGARQPMAHRSLFTRLRALSASDCKSYDMLKRAWVPARDMRWQRLQMGRTLVLGAGPT